MGVIIDIGLASVLVAMAEVVFEFDVANLSKILSSFSVMALAACKQNAWFLSRGLATLSSCEARTDRFRIRADVLIPDGRLFEEPCVIFSSAVERTAAEGRPQARSFSTLAIPRGVERGWSCALFLAYHRRSRHLYCANSPFGQLSPRYLPRPLAVQEEGWSCPLQEGGISGNEFGGRPDEPSRAYNKSSEAYRSSNNLGCTSDGEAGCPKSDGIEKPNSWKFISGHSQQLYQIIHTQAGPGQMPEMREIDSQQFPPETDSAYSAVEPKLPPYISHPCSNRLL